MGYNTRFLARRSNGLDRSPLHDQNSDNSLHGQDYRADTDVDMALISDQDVGDILVGWTVSGEWLRYTVNVEEPGEELVVHAQPRRFRLF